MAAKKACHHVATKKPHAPWRLKGILLCGCHTPTLGTHPPADLGCVPVAPQLWVPVPQWTWGASQPHPHLHLGYWAPNGPMTPFGPDCCGTVAAKERKKEKQHCSSTKHSLHCGSTNNTLPCGSSKNTQHSGSTKIGSNTKKHCTVAAPNTMPQCGSTKTSCTVAAQKIRCTAAAENTRKINSCTVAALTKQKKTMLYCGRTKKHAALWQHTNTQHYDNTKNMQHRTIARNKPHYGSTAISAAPWQHTISCCTMAAT